MKIIIRFSDIEEDTKAIAYLAGRFTFTTWKTGEMMVSDIALPALAREGIRFNVERPASYMQQAFPFASRMQDRR